MRLNINLASQPYQDVRRFIFRWGFVVTVTAIVTMALLWAAISDTISWRKTVRQSSYYQHEIEKCEQRKTAAEAALNRPENRMSRDQSVFINTLIARKAFSWTEVLSDLEDKKIMPSGIQVVGIAPKINESGQLEIHLAASGPSRENAIKLIYNMESSPHFRNAMLVSDTAETDQRSGVNYRFDISAIYVPSYSRAAANDSSPMLAKKQEER